MAGSRFGESSQEDREAAEEEERRREASAAAREWACQEQTQLYIREMTAAARGTLLELLRACDGTTDPKVAKLLAAYKILSAQARDLSKLTGDEPREELLP